MTGTHPTKEGFHADHNRKCRGSADRNDLRYQRWLRASGIGGLTHDELWKAPTDRNESYHVGQLVYVRKRLGYPGLAG